MERYDVTLSFNRPGSDEAATVVLFPCSEAGCADGILVARCEGGHYHRVSDDTARAGQSVVLPGAGAYHARGGLGMTSGGSVDVTELKRQAAERAVGYVESGMVVGLGAGSTASLALRALAARLRDGRLRGIAGIPCSLRVEADARGLGIPLTSLDEHPVIDLTIDGADEVDPALDLIKGGGGALLREKILAQASRREIIVVDAGKLSPALGTRWALPVEVVPFGLGMEERFLVSLGARVSRRRGADGNAFITDQGNVILDCAFGTISDAAGLARTLDARAAIVEHGLFVGLASEVIVAGGDGVRRLVREGRDGD